jgi:hypothetical protein
MIPTLRLSCPRPHAAGLILTSILALLPAAVAAPATTAVTAEALASGFATPPEEAKPWTWWHWMNGNVTKSGITADLESMKRVGIGGFLVFHVGQLPFDGDVKYLSPEWWNLMRFTAEESQRLGLRMGFHNCPGWTSSGGPWVPVEQSMQKVVWSETQHRGPGQPGQPLPRPTVDPKWNHYRDVAVIALPQSTNIIPSEQVINLTGRMDADGRLAWDAPAGDWVILRFGHTTTGKENHPAPIGGAGLEADKMSKAAITAHFRAYPEKVLANAGPARAAITTVEIDSYEAGPQTWTPGYESEFQRRLGYDPLPWLPVMAGRVIGSLGQSARFSNDMSRVTSTLFAENYFAHFRSLVRAHPGLEFTLEPSTFRQATQPYDDLTAGEHADLLMAEFWQNPRDYRGMGTDTTRRVASMAHTTGKSIVAAEAFTGVPIFGKWTQDPYGLKATGDAAFCKGINRFVLHTITHQPWPDRARPGMTMSWWGTHFGRTQTWWEKSRRWFEYITRCQFLLQQGRPVADVLFLDNREFAPPAGYDADTISELVFLRDVTASNGVMTLPHGGAYRVLVLPARRAMTPEVARKLADLARAGVAILGPKPDRSPSLSNFPKADGEVRRIATALWDKGTAQTNTNAAEALVRMGVPPDFTANIPDITWVHRRTDDADIYFVSNQEETERLVDCTFRVAGKQPELWDATTAEIRPAGTYRIQNGATHLPLKLDPRGSVFVVFRHATTNLAGTTTPNWPEFRPVRELAGPWNLRFDPAWGPFRAESNRNPGEFVFEQLDDWSRRGEPAIRYYSGTATYEKTFELDAGTQAQPLWLDLGDVKNLAEVELNGVPLGVLWKPPFRADIQRAARAGTNSLVIKVTNLWPNRLIGDEQEPTDMVWGEPRPWKAPPPSDVGRPLQEIPAWFTAGQPRPSPGRYTFTAWKFYEKDSPLLPSGLLGPVRVLTRH